MKIIKKYSKYFKEIKLNNKLFITKYKKITKINTEINSKTIIETNIKPKKLEFNKTCLKCKKLFIDNGWSYCNTCNMNRFLNNEHSNI